MIRRFRLPKWNVSGLPTSCSPTAQSGSTHYFGDEPSPLHFRQPETRPAAMLKSPPFLNPTHPESRNHARPAPIPRRPRRPRHAAIYRARTRRHARSLLSIVRIRRPARCHPCPAARRTPNPLLPRTPRADVPLPPISRVPQGRVSRVHRRQLSRGAARMANAVFRCRF